MRRRRYAFLLAASLFASSCFGSFQLTRTIWTFNRDVGGKWVQEVLFLAMVIIPVYEVVALVDILVFNTAEFWSGNSPTARADGGAAPDVKIVALPDGTELRIVRESQDTLRVERGDEIRWFHRTGDGIEAIDENGAVLAVVKGASNGDVEVTDALGTKVYSAEQLALVGRSAVSVATWAAEQVRDRQIASGK